MAVVSSDPALLNVPTTSPETESRSDYVILPASASSGFAPDRLVLGPSTVGYSELASAEASKHDGIWVVDISLTSAGTKRLQNLAQQQFHAYIAIEVDGKVLDAPLIEGTATSFKTAGLGLEIGGQTTESDALTLADDLTSPLEIPLRLASPPAN
jgi:preprotein translocase subunit SecD